MADVNHVILIGRLTRDAEMKYTSGGAAVMKFSIALNRKKKQGDQWVDEANFFDVELWGKQAEAINQYMVKGKRVAVEGGLKQDRWEQDGKKQSKVHVIADNVQLLDGGTPREGSGQGGGQGSGHSSVDAARAASESSEGDYGEEIPF